MEVGVAPGHFLSSISRPGLPIALGSPGLIGDTVMERNQLGEGAAYALGAVAFTVAYLLSSGDGFAAIVIVVAIATAMFLYGTWPRG